MVTDHHSLCWLFKKRDLSGRLARWSLQLQDLDIDIVHRSGRLHSDADGLSRAPMGAPEEEEEIPLLTNFPATIPKKIDIALEQQRSSWWEKIIGGLKEENPNPRVRKLIHPYELRNGVLYRKRVHRGQLSYQLCLPFPYVKQILLACHSDVTSGHLGVVKTLYKIQQRYFWPGMRRNIVGFVLSCVDCQTKKRPREAPAGLLQSTRVNQPFEKVGIDLIGPFPITAAGNRHAIVAVDYLTKWAIVKAVPKASAKEVVDFFVRNVVLQHGAPVFLISDRGKCLSASFAEELFKALQTNHLVTAAYHPQCNGLVERYNHTFAEMLSMYVNSYHNDWDGLVDFVTFAYNTSRQESTGYSPFYLLYGREAVLPVDVALGNNPELNKGEDGHSEHLRQLTSELPTIRDEVKRRLVLVQSKQKTRYDRKRRSINFAEGNLVLVYRPIRKKGRSTKFLHRYFGPYKIIRRVSDLNYIVEPLCGRRKKQDCVHVSHLKPFRIDTSGESASAESLSALKKTHPCEEKVRKKTPRKTPTVRQKNVRSSRSVKKKCDPGGEQSGGHLLRSRQTLRSPDRLDL